MYELHKGGRREGRKLAKPATSVSVIVGAAVISATSAIAGDPPQDNTFFFDSFVKAYVDEWGKPPPDPNPNDPPTRRPITELPPAPVSIPPMPFVEWPFGGASPIGATVPNSQGGTLMKALAPTDMGKWMKDNHLELYGWINAGGNVSTAQDRTQGNWPAAYGYMPDTFQLDQAVVYLERLPDTVQKDHIDWGFRLSAIYGENYRYTTSLGIADYQLQKRNYFAGYDFPMLYGELYIPGIADGAVIRAGRFISVPDIEAQLAPNNYMYSHSMTYAYDNYTNTGVNVAVQLNKNWQIQFGILDGTEVALWKPSSQDPGKQPTGEACLRWVSDSANDSFFACADGINKGNWGYNNLQWYGITYYHKFNKEWHLSAEFWDMHQDNVPDVNNTDAYAASPFAYMKNGPFAAVCKGNASSSTGFCTAKEWSALAYLNYQFSPMDNISWRVELFDDINGQRTGTATRYFNYAVGWQHWFSPSVTFRPEIAWYNSLDAKAFDQPSPTGAPTFCNGCGTKDKLTVMSADLIWHF